MPYLVLKDINKIYPNGFHAVHDFNLEIEKGEFIVFVGSSGCGKSTTLRMIAGLEDISKGDFLIDGQRANEKGPRDRGVAMVFQSYALYPQMTVYDNLAFGLTLEGIDEDIIEEKVKNVAKILGLTDYLDRLPKALSGGQRQRVAVGRAIVRQPKVFLFDEPLSNLDAKLRVQMRAEISGLHHRLKATMIYVTHDQVEALTMADKIVVMKLGVIQQIGGPLELYNNPDNKFVAGFIGSPPMNFINTKVEAQGDKILVNEGTFKLEVTPAQAKFLKPYVGKNVTFGIRPEDVEFTHTPEAGKTIDGHVSVVEPLGAETHVYVATSTAKVIGKIDGTVIPAVDTKISLIPNMDKAKFFDAETELAIR